MKFSAQNFHLQLPAKSGWVIKNHPCIESEMYRCELVILKFPILAWRPWIDTCVHFQGKLILSSTELFEPWGSIPRIPSAE